MLNALRKLWAGPGWVHPTSGATHHGNAFDDTCGRRFYYTGKSPRARWQRFQMWRAYRRPVTYADLRKIAHAAAYPHPDPYQPGKPDLRRPEPAGVALFDRIIDAAEQPVFVK